MQAESAVAQRTSFVSVTRLRLRSIRFVPGFALHAIRTRNQCTRSPGYLRGALLPDRQWTFWTLTVWDSEQSMRSYMLSGDHRKAMPHLMHWCDQASVAHWRSDDAELPSWPEVDHRMRSEGRPSKVLHPAPGHADLTFRAPRLSMSTPMPGVRT